jgi:hypothetical protein
MFLPNPLTGSLDPVTPATLARELHEATLSDLQSMEVLGSVPIWVLSGLRLERMGERLVAPGWAVGVYRTADEGEKEVVPRPAVRERMPGKS